MKTPAPLRTLLLALLLGLAFAVFAQDDVTIPKSRLQELERKEKELEKLKSGQPNPDKPAPEVKTPSQPAAPSPVPAPAAPPAVTHESPPLATLPPFKEGGEIDSLDLANYYRQDAAAADQRYRHHKITVRGEIAGFEKPMFRRNYRILLKTADRDMRVICDLLMPEGFSAVFTANHGSELVGAQGETRVPLARVGEIVQVQGECKGLRDGVVMINGSAFTKVK